MPDSSADVGAALKKINISFIDYEELFESLKTCRLRDDLASIEKGSGSSLCDHTFWDISLKYRYDVLCEEIVRIPNDLAYAIYWSNYYKPKVRNDLNVAPNSSDHFFWFFISMGIRLVSSGWDRIALVLDLAFNTQLGPKCNLAQVLRVIQKNSGVTEHNSFRNLKRFRDNELKELEDGSGKGARHEATHLISPSSRFFFELIEIDCNPSLASHHLNSDGWFDLLTKHHPLFRKGIEDMASLITEMTPITLLCPHCNNEIPVYCEN
ncbi:MAG: hypothetical protein ACYC6Z_08965 [Thermoleophilia bacterium]